MIGSKGQYAAARGIPLDTMYGFIMRRQLRFATVRQKGRQMLDFERADRVLERAGYWNDPKSFKPPRPPPVRENSVSEYPAQSDGLILKEIKDFVSFTDPKADSNGVEFKAAVCLMATNSIDKVTVSRLCQFTGYPRPFVSTLLKNWRANDILIGQGESARMIMTDWTKDEFVVEVWLYAMVGVGCMIRIVKDGKAFWHLAPDCNAAV